MEIGTKIRRERINRGYSQDYMAQQMGISPKTYSRLEAGTSKIDMERLAAISQILEVEPTELIEGDEKYGFYFCQQENNGVVINHNNYSEKERELYEKLLQKQEAIIKHLEARLLDIDNK